MAINTPVTKTVISTTGWGIPVTNQLNTNTTDIAALKTVVPWINLTLQNGWAAAGGMTPQYRKIGDIVYIRGSAGIGAGGLGSNICILPAGYRPPFDMQVGTIAYTTLWSIAEYDVLSASGAVRYNSTSPPAPSYVPLACSFSITP